MAEFLLKVLIPVVPTVIDEVVYLDAFEEEKFISTAATTPIDENGHFLVARCEVRKYGEPTTEAVHHVDLFGVAANQIISIATSLIPFIEHNDGQRALMGNEHATSGCPIDYC